jgi:hypothetical protein
MGRKLHLSPGLGMENAKILNALYILVIYQNQPCTRAQFSRQEFMSHVVCRYNLKNACSSLVKTAKVRRITKYQSNPN